MVVAAFTDSHEHTWSPVAMLRGRYACRCGVQGYRAKGYIRLARRRQRDDLQVSVLAYTTGSGGRVPALPTLEQTERM